MLIDGINFRLHLLLHIKSVEIVSWQQCELECLAGLKRARLKNGEWNSNVSREFAHPNIWLVIYFNLSWICKCIELWPSIKVSDMSWLSHWAYWRGMKFRWGILKSSLFCQVYQRKYSKASEKSKILAPPPRCCCFTNNRPSKVETLVGILNSPRIKKLETSLYQPCDLFVDRQQNHEIEINCFPTYSSWRDSIAVQLMPYPNTYSTSL